MREQKTFADHGIRIQADGPTEQKTTCPECSHDRKKKGERCLSVNVVEGVWNCHHCGWSGNLTPRRELRRFTPLPIERRPKPMKEEAAPTFFEAFHEKRGITPEVAKRNGVQAVTHFMPQVEQERSCIAFPYRVGGEIVAVKYRDAEKNFTQEKGGARIFYKIDDIAEVDHAIITEGEIDALSLEVAGYSNAISIPDGAPPPGATNVGRKLRFLDECVDRLAHVERFTLAVDNDAPGIALRDELARRLGKDRCWIVDWPAGCKDANDVLVQLGAEELAGCIAQAKPYPVEGSRRVGDFYEQLVDLYTHGYPDVAGCGDDEIDSLLRFARGAMTTVTGTPNSGKSTYIDNITMRHAVANDWRISYFTPEHRNEDHTKRLAEILVGRRFLPGAGQMNRDEFDKVIRFLEDHVYYIQPTDETYELEEILRIAEYHVRAYGVDALVIDPWNRIEHHIGKAETESIYTGRMLHRMQSFARRNGVHLFLIAHPRKMGTKMNSGGGTSMEIPNLYSISGSANFYNMTDNGVTVYREVDAETGGTLANTVYVQKVKQTHWGRLGKADYTYDINSQRFLPGKFQNVAPGGQPAWVGGVKPGSARELERIHNEIGGANDAPPF